MKKIILMLAMFGAFVTTQAQVMQKPVRQVTPVIGNYEEPELLPRTPFFLRSGFIVPEKTQTAFRKSYGSPEATWKKEGNDYKVTFKSKGKEKLETIVLYDANGKVLLKEKEFLSDAGPVAISNYCREHMIATNSRIWEVDSKDGVRKYFVKVDKETVWFDRNGALLGSNGTEVAHHAKKAAMHKTKTTGHNNSGMKYHHAGYYK